MSIYNFFNESKINILCRQSFFKIKLVVHASYYIMELSDMYVLLNQCSELSRCQRPLDEEGDSYDNKKKKSLACPACFTKADLLMNIYIVKIS